MSIVDIKLSYLKTLDFWEKALLDVKGRSEEATIKRWGRPKASIESTIIFLRADIEEIGK